MTESDKVRILQVVRHKSLGLASVQHQQSLLRQAAALIPNFCVFQMLCVESLKAAWLEDRLSNRRTTQTLRRAWERLFRHFARLRLLEANLRIRAANKAGAYECVLEKKPDTSSEWRHFLQMGKHFGIYPSELEHLARRAKKRSVASGRRQQKS